MGAERLIFMVRLSVAALGLAIAAAATVLALIGVSLLLLWFIAHNRTRIVDWFWFAALTCLAALPLLLALMALAPMFTSEALTYSDNDTTISALRDMPWLAPLTWLADRGAEHFATIAAATAGAIALVCIVVVRIATGLRQRRMNQLAQTLRRPSTGTGFILFLRPFTLDAAAETEFASMFSGAVMYRWGGVGLAGAALGVNLFDTKAFYLEALIERLLAKLTQYHPLDTEVAIARAARDIGPVVAIGLTPAISGGAARIVCSDETWKAEVEDLAKRADMIVFVPGRGAGTQWEITHVAEHHRDKTIWIMPPGGKNQSEGGDAASVESEWFWGVQAMRRGGLAVSDYYNNRGGVFFMKDGEFSEHLGLSFYRLGKLRRALRAISARAPVSA